MTSNSHFSGNNNSGLQQGQNYGININQFVSHNPSEKEAQECHQLFQLANGRDSYEFYKARVAKRIPGTCEWFLKHPDYISWKQADTGTLLVSADPGCGKSVLAKHLVEHDLPGMVCYFFFKDLLQNTLKEALCAIIHQLFVLRPGLIKHAMPKYKQNREKLIDLTTSLWEILQQATLEIEAHVTIVLDALDECNTDELRDLTEMIVDHHLSSKAHLKFLLTCRPYQYILTDFWRLLPNIHIPGEVSSAEIAREIDLVIEHRVNEIAQKHRISGSLKKRIKTRLNETPHRTYLWIHLVFEQLEKGFTKTPKGVDSMISQLPQSLNQAYESILERSTDLEKARKALMVILASETPLTIEEMNMALHIDDQSGCIQNIDREDDEDFKHTLRDWCGLLISIYEGKVTFLHQTAREFLLAGQLESSTWRASISIENAHASLAHICLLCITLQDFNFGSEETFEVFEEAAMWLGAHHTLQSLVKTPLFEYATRHWAKHFQMARNRLDQSTRKLAIKACGSIVSHERRPFWFLYFSRGDKFEFYRSCTTFSPLMVASHFGLQSLIQSNTLAGDINYVNEQGDSALNVAVRGGHKETVQTLLARGAKIDAINLIGETVLHEAISNENIEIVRLLLQNGANTNVKNSFGYWALHHSIQYSLSHEFILLSIEMMLQYGAIVDSQDPHGQSALHCACNYRVQDVAKLLLEHGADVNLQDSSGNTPLHTSCLEINMDMIALLMDHGADPSIVNKYGHTAGMLLPILQNQ